MTVVSCIFWNYVIFVFSIPLYSCDVLHTTVLNFQVFSGNMDKSTERHHYLNHPFTARYVRINPVTWHHAIALRAGLTGCPHTGDCGPGFVQVNSLSRCGKHSVLTHLLYYMCWIIVLSHLFPTLCLWYIY
jgi:F5/8 type C domain.